MKHWQNLLRVAASAIAITAMLAGCSSPKPADTGANNNTTTPNAETAPKTEPKTENQQAATGKATVKFLNGKEQVVGLMDDMIKQFEADNPNIKVEHEFQKEASNVIKVKFASGDAPDVTTVYEQVYVDDGKYRDLSDEAFWSRVNPAIKDMCADIKTGKQYRIATNMTMAGIFYNKEIFNELGLKEALTWQEFTDNCAKIAAAKPDVAPLYMGGKESWMLGHMVEFMAHGVIKQSLGNADAAKAFVYNEKDKLNFDAADGPMASFAERFIELRDKNYLNTNFLTATADNQTEAFASGRAAMISNGMWALSGILEKNPDMADKIGFSPYPPIIDGMKPVILSAEDSAYTIIADSANEEAALTFLNFLLSPENLKTYSEFIKSPCSFTDVTADWGPLKDEVNAALQKGVNIGFTTTPAGFGGDDSGRMIQDLYAGEYKTAQDFANAYTEAWNKAWESSNK